MFAEKPRIVTVGELRDQASREKLCRYVRDVRPGEPASLARVDVELPEVKISHYPSEPRNHNIVADTPLAAWRNLISG